jgi:ribosome biogenesis SPOUT family RNA methylase Rps3
MKYVIEHLEPEMYEWCLIEYRHISKIVGKESLIFTNVKKGAEKLEGLGEVHPESVKELGLKNVCLLDADAKETLSPADKKFGYLVFGGILGDNPPQKRTAKHLGSLKAEQRNLLEKQMPTDTAVFVAKKIIDGTAIDKINFKDEIEVPTGEGESAIFPFRYVLVDGKPLISEELIEHLKKSDDF